MIYDLPVLHKEQAALRVDRVDIRLVEGAMDVTGSLGEVHTDGVFRADTDLRPVYRSIEGREFAAFLVEHGAIGLASFETALAAWLTAWGWRDGQAWYDANPEP